MRLRGDVIFVTGGAGFIGSAVLRHLLNSTEAFVVNIDKLTYASCLDSIPQARSNSRYRFAHVDICDGEAIRQLFQEYQPRFVMNLAAESHVDRSIDGPDAFVQTNIVGTFTLLKEALSYWSKLDLQPRNRFRFQHISTDEVFGSLGSQGLFDENSRYQPNSPYSASKASSDHLVRAWHETYELPTIITNCSNNYGPYQFPEKLIPLIIIRGLFNQPMPVYGDGQNVRDWLYVEDHVNALVLSIEHGVAGETYNIGGRNEFANIDVVRAICQTLDILQPSASGAHERLISFIQDRPGHDRRYAVDPSKIERELGWRPKETFETGLRKTIEWYASNRNWWGSLLERNHAPCIQSPRII